MLEIKLRKATREEVAAEPVPVIGPPATVSCGEINATQSRRVSATLEITY